MHWRLTLMVALTLAGCSSQSHGDASPTSNQPTAAPAVAVASPPAASSYAAGSLDGQVLGAGAPIANSLVTLWAATSEAPKQLAQTRTDRGGNFALSFGGGDGILYLVASGGEPAAAKTSGDNPAIALISVLGSQAPPHAVVNEMTTVASVWTMNQFINGTAIEGATHSGCASAPGTCRTSWISRPAGGAMRFKTR